MAKRQDEAGKAVNGAFTDRMARLIDLDTISLISILVAGLGRVGMSLVRQLAAFPVARIIGIDHDTLAGKDLGTVFPAMIRERHKALAARAVIQAWNPSIVFEPVLMKLSKATMPRFRECVRRADLLVWAADDWPVLELVSAEFHDRLPMVGVAMAESGAFAEIAWSAPGQTQPLAATLQASHKTRVDGAASLPVDVDYTANVALSVCLGIVLAGRIGYELFGNLLDPSCPLLIVHNRPNAFTRSSNALVPKLIRLVPGARR